MESISFITNKVATTTMHCTLLLLLYCPQYNNSIFAFSTLTVFIGHQQKHLACKK